MATGEWTATLKLTTAWSFDAIRTTAIDNLAFQQTIDPVFALVRAQEYDVRECFAMSNECPHPLRWSP
jgi:hypothetical protein